MKKHHLIVPRKTLADILTMIEEGDSDNAHYLLKATIDLCPLCNRAEAEAAPALLAACESLLWGTNNMERWLGIGEDLEKAQAAIAKAKAPQC